MRCPSFMWAYSVTELSTLDVIYLCVCASGIRVIRFICAGLPVPFPPPTLPPPQILSPLSYTPAFLPRLPPVPLETKERESRH